MKLAIRIALSLSLIFPGSVFAKGDAAMRSPTLQDKDAFFATAERVLNAKRGSNLATFNREKMRKTIKEGQRQALAAPAKSLAHMSQTFVLLWILGGIEAVKQDRKLSPLQNKAHSKLSLVADAGDHMINSFDLFASMALASATSAVMAGQCFTTIDFIQCDAAIAKKPSQWRSRIAGRIFGLGIRRQTLGRGHLVARFR